MSAFEFFFSFYGLLLLGLPLAVIATGAVAAIQHRRKWRIGWLTPALLALNQGVTAAVQVALVVPAALVRGRLAFAMLIGLHIAPYMVSAILSAASPAMTEQVTEGPPPVAARP